MVKDVSFVVITYNESFGIEKCLDSIFRLDLNNCEVICVDSGSTDGTIDVIRKFMVTNKNLSLFHIKGYANAAIGRNVGIKKSSKEFIFFVDGDVEVNEEFLNKSLNLLIANKADAVTGSLCEYQYDTTHEKVLAVVKDRYNIKREGPVCFTGGIFITKRSVIEKVGDFDESFKRHQDLDYTLRLSAKFRLIALNLPMGIHHTVPYHNWGRLRNNMTIFNRLFGKLVIKNLVINPKGIFNLLRQNTGITYSFIYLCFLALGLYFFKITTVVLIAGLLFSADMIYGLCKGRNIAYRFFLHYVSPVTIIIGLFRFGKVGEWTIFEEKTQI